jgi:hypothetical protein
VIEMEPGSGGKESAEATIRNLAGHICIADKPGAGRSKEVRAEPIEHLRRAPEILDPGEDPDPYGMMKDISVLSDDTGK